MFRKSWIYLCALASLLPGGKAADKPAQAPSSTTVPGPVSKNLKVEEADALLRQNPGVTILDVRRPDEFAEGHLARAKNYDFYDHQFREKLSKLDKNKPYLVHCASGFRSAKARDILKGLNFKQVYHLEGGIMAWTRAGKPVVK